MGLFNSKKEAKIIQEIQLISKIEEDIKIKISNLEIGNVIKLDVPIVLFERFESDEDYYKYPNFSAILETRYMELDKFINLVEKYSCELISYHYQKGNFCLFRKLKK